MIELGKGGQREVVDWILSRLACYLVAMNGDPRKPEIASAQTYFVVQTRRTEVWDELRNQVAERADLREQLAEANKQLNATAKESGLNSRSFGRLHDAGTRGLYGDLTGAQVKSRKGIGAREDHADRMGSAELIANAFVRSQTEQKIRNEPIRETDHIMQAHYEVGAETRGVIQRTGGTLPEDLPAEPSIRPLLDQRGAHEDRIFALKMALRSSMRSQLPNKLTTRAGRVNMGQRRVLATRQLCAGTRQTNDSAG